MEMNKTPFKVFMEAKEQNYTLPFEENKPKTIYDRENCRVKIEVVKGKELSKRMKEYELLQLNKYKDGLAFKVKENPSPNWYYKLITIEVLWNGKLLKTGEAFSIELIKHKVQNNAEIKQKQTIYLTPDLMAKVKQKATDESKSISKVICDVVDESFGCKQRTMFDEEEIEELWTKEKIYDLLTSNNQAVLKGIITLYESQSESERISGMLNKHDGKGFNRFDFPFFREIYNKLSKGYSITQYELNLARNKILKYSKQLAYIANEKSI